MDSKKVLNALMMMASALPAVGQAEGVPQDTTIRFKQLNYIDYQKDKDRMKVSAPMMMVNTGISDHIEFDASFVSDSVSGASPRMIHTLSGASGKGISERRNAVDMKATYHAGDTAIGVGFNHSKENDYLSNSVSVDARFSTPDRNTTYAIGLSKSNDSISKTGDDTLHENKYSHSVFAGITKVLSPVMVAQSNIAYTSGHGFYNDPYKNFENRPSTKHEFAWLNRLNYYLTDYDTALHLDYRYMQNSWGVKSHMVEASAYKNMGNGWTIRPSIRSYSQSQASFYSTNITDLISNTYTSADSRLGSYGSVTLGLKAIKKLDDHTSLDISYDHYMQKSSLKWGGNGSSDFVPFYARFLMFGISYKF